MNDGAVVFRDLKWESRESGGGFLRKVVRLHRVVNRHDQMLGFPGARTVIAVGHRQRGLERGIVMDQAQLDRLTVRADSGELDVRTALAHAFHARPVYGYVPELQANFAFTKAFVAEHAGSRIGLSGPRCFVDTALLNGDAEWIELGDRCWLRWSTIAAEFAEVTSLDPRAANLARWIGLRTGSEVDAALSRLRPPSRIAYLASTVRHTARSRLRRIGRY